MAQLRGKILFLTTSPRSPEKIVAEIALLAKHFRGANWNRETQVAFMTKLRDEDFFHGTGSNDPALSARDRITRAPKALGFVRLSPTIDLTPAGESLIHSERNDEIFLRQLLKYQLPSPYHTLTPTGANFCVKPYLEILRLIRYFGSLRFDELQLFGLQLIHYNRFESITNQIKDFRAIKDADAGNLNLFGLGR